MPAGCKAGPPASGVIFLFRSEEGGVTTCATVGPYVASVQILSAKSPFRLYLLGVHSQRKKKKHPFHDFHIVAREIVCNEGIYGRGNRSARFSNNCLGSLGKSSSTAL